MSYRSPNQRAVTPQGRGAFPGFDVLDEVDRWGFVKQGLKQKVQQYLPGLKEES